MGFVNLTILIYWKDELPSREIRRSQFHRPTERMYTSLTVGQCCAHPARLLCSLSTGRGKSVWEKTECSWTMVLEFRVKQRVGWIKKRTGWSYCDFLMFVHQRTREDNGHQYGKRFLIRIHKSVRWPCTYDNTDLLMAGSSIGEDIRFSFWEEEFDSPTRYK